MSNCFTALIFFSQSLRGTNMHMHVFEDCDSTDSTVNPPNTLFSGVNWSIFPWYELSLRKRKDRGWFLFLGLEGTSVFTPWLCARHVCFALNIATLFFVWEGFFDKFSTVFACKNKHAMLVAARFYRKRKGDCLGLISIHPVSLCQSVKTGELEKSLWVLMYTG